MMNCSRNRRCWREADVAFIYKKIKNSRIVVKIECE